LKRKKSRKNLKDTTAKRIKNKGGKRIIRVGGVPKKVGKAQPETGGDGEVGQSGSGL